MTPIILSILLMATIIVVAFSPVMLLVIPVGRVILVVFDVIVVFYVGSVRFYTDPDAITAIQMVSWRKFPDMSPVSAIRVIIIAGSNIEINSGTWIVKIIKRVVIRMRRAVYPRRPDTITVITT